MRLALSLALQSGTGTEEPLIRYRLAAAQEASLPIKTTLTDFRVILPVSNGAKTQSYKASPFKLGLKEKLSETLKVSEVCRDAKFA